MLSVKGTIGAKEVIITNSGWADDVFSPSYQLMPLRGIRAFVEEHHHLPGIPSENEVAEHGIGLGEMQVKLLAKIEELTLHMIAAEDRSSRLEQKVRDLQGQYGETK
jgi:hypothetical protein